MATRRDSKTSIALAAEVFREHGIFQSEVGNVVGASQAQGQPSSFGDASLKALGVAVR